MPCPIEMVQAQLVDPGDGVVAHPLLAGAVRARDEQPVQHADEHRPLECELEAAAIQELVRRLAQPQPLPQPRPADADAGETACLHVGQHHRPLRMPRQRGDQAIELAAGVQDVLAAERADRALAHPLALADALDEVKIAAPPGDLFADEHSGVVCGNDANIKRNRSKT